MIHPNCHWSLDLHDASSPRRTVAAEDFVLSCLLSYKTGPSLLFHTHTFLLTLLRLLISNALFFTKLLKFVSIVRNLQTQSQSADCRHSSKTQGPVTEWQPSRKRQVKLGAT